MTTWLVLAGLAALAFAGIAFLVSAVVDDEDDVTAPTTQPTAPTATQTTGTTTAGTTMPPPPPEPPPAPLEGPAGTALVARVVTNAEAVVTATRNRVGDRLRVVKRETGVYAVSVPGFSPAQRREAVIRVRPAAGGRDVKVSARKVGPGAEFVVFAREAKTGAFTDGGFELAVFLPKQDLEATAAEEEGERPQLPGTR
jgi:hypothetical protein